MTSALLPFPHRLGVGAWMTLLLCGTMTMTMTFFVLPVTGEIQTAKDLWCHNNEKDSSGNVYYGAIECKSHRKTEYCCYREFKTRFPQFGCHWAVEEDCTAGCMAPEGRPIMCTCITDRCNDDEKMNKTWENDPVFQQYHSGPSTSSPNGSNMAVAVVSSALPLVVALGSLLHLV